MAKTAPACEPAQVRLADDTLCEMWLSESGLCSLFFIVSLRKVMHLDYYDLGEQLYLDGDYKKACEMFKRGVAQGTDKNDCLNYLGCCHIHLGNLEQALNIFDELISSTEWERPLFNKGRVYLKLGDLDNALICFEKAALLNPNNPDVFYYLGLYYDKKKEYETALFFYRKSLSLDEDQPETHLNLGVIYLRLGKLDKALKEFNISKLDRDYTADSLANIGTVFYKKKLYYDALENFLLAHELLPNDTLNLNDIANCHFHLRNHSECLNWLNRVLDIDPNNEEAIEHRKTLMKTLHNF